MNYVVIKNLSIIINKNEILKNINFEISSGDRIGIMGKNGAGKTTLIETIIGVNSASVTGTLKFNNNIQKSIKAVLQNYVYDNSLSLKNLYKIYSLIAGVKPEHEVKKVFEKYELEHCLKRKYNTLSGGEQQKFKLLMCLELKPKLLIIDEISTSLDYFWRTEILTVINEYIKSNPDCALVLVSHDYNELSALTNKIYLIKDKTNTLIKNLEDYFYEKTSK